MIRNGLLAIVSMFVFSFVSNVARAATGNEFRCERNLSVSNTEDYLHRLGEAIQADTDSPDLLKSSDVMLNFLKKVLCFHDTQGDIIIFEWLLPVENTNVYGIALSRLEKKDQQVIKQSLIDLKVDFED